MTLAATNEHGEASVRVFAYGSNLCTQRMRSRAPSASPVTIGYVRQRRLVFHKRSEGVASPRYARRLAGHDARFGGQGKNELVRATYSR